MGKLIDLAGQRFGRLTVLQRAGSDAYNNAMWLCRCDCGNEKAIAGVSLRSGATRSCGCLHQEMPTLRVDITGQRFGRLLAIKRSGTSKSKLSLWLCHCDCGKEIIADIHSLRKGNTTSCGCARIKHGGTHTRLYKIWKGMKNRCYEKSHTAYSYYGGRGITICDEWLKDFAAFRAWAISHGYSDNLSIDRIDNDQGYSPGNCRWATAKEQASNRRNCKINK